MKQLIENGQTRAIASYFEKTSDGWVGDGVVYPLSVVGNDCTVVDYTPPPPVIEPPAPEVRRITELAFRSRFTMKEKVATELASVVNQSDPLAMQELAASIRALKDDISAASYIDLDRPDTRAGVSLMEEYGIIAAGRAAEILDNPVQDFERYNG